MAKAVYGPNVVQLNGSVASVTYFRGYGGDRVRARIKPPNPKSAAQVAQRAAFQAARAAYSTAITDAQRRTWIQWGIDHPTAQGLWGTESINGMAAYTKVNFWAEWLGLTVLNDPPPVYTVTPITDLEISVLTSAPQKCVITYQGGNIGDYLVVYVSKPVPPGQLSRWRRKMTSTNADTQDGSHTLDITGGILAYATFPASGQRFGVMAHALSPTNYATHVRLQASAICA